MIQKCLYKFLSRIISELGLDFKDELSFTNRQIRYNIQENHKVTILYLKKIPYFTKAVLQEKGSNIHTHTATDPKHTNMNARTRARTHTNKWIHCIPVSFVPIWTLFRDISCILARWHDYLFLLPGTKNQVFPTLPTHYKCH